MNILDKFFETSVLTDKTPIEIIELIAKYDFRMEYICEGYQKSREVDGVKFHSDLLKKGDAFDRFVAYKVLTDPGSCKFDVDNCLGTCSVVGEIYKKLWRTNIEYSNFMTIKDCFDEDGKKVLFGGDVYNSLQISTGLSKKEVISLYIKNSKELKISLYDMQEVMEVSHVIGNLGLVPAYYNSYRGMSGTIEDYLDRSLLELKQNGFNYLDILIKTNGGPEKKKDPVAFANKKKNQYKDFSVADYEKYINLMFLWDMHTEDNKIRDISFSMKKWKEVVPLIIKRRSLFMAMMLFFSYNREEVYMKMLKKIVDEKNILNYESVFALLNEVEGLTELDKRILEEMKAKILKLEIDTKE